MTEGIERELIGLDADRPLSPQLYSRLEAALLEEAETRPEGADEDAALFDALDAPRPIPPATRAALERALTIPAPRRDPRSVLLGAAAAVLLVVGAVGALRAGGPHSNRQVAVGPGHSVPTAGLPPVLQAPSTAPAQPAAGVAAPAAPRAPVRSTTTTTWNCGLCARNGYARAVAPAASPTTSGGTWQPSGGHPANVAASAAAESAMTVEPSSGPRRGGTIVTLTGSGFTGASGVNFGSTAAVNYTVVSDTEIRVMAPPSPARGPVGVVVTFPDGTSTPTGDNAPTFTYN